MFKVLVVEPDQKLNSLFCSFLEGQGYKVISVRGAIDAMKAVEDNRIDIVICDMQLPDLDGTILMQALRDAESNIPIIVLSSVDDFKSKQRAYAAECDDFMVKPIDLNELILRITAVLRRAHSVSKRKITIGDAVLDSDSLSVVEGSSSTVLPPKEFMILFKLCSSAGRIFSRRDIMDDVWGIHSESGERTVDVHVKRLRERFESSKSFRIDTVRGVGYKVTALR